MWRSLKARDVAEALGLVKHPEGGYFIEKHRSGSVPMKTKGQTDFSVPTHFKMSTQGTLTFKPIEELHYEPLTVAPGRESRRTDRDIRRNCLTSIIWMPVSSNPILPLAVNCSDHVHYYHGGNPFQYTIYNSNTNELYREILGPAITEGQTLQVVVPGGLWKCGRMMCGGECDYSLIGEAVAPGFDFHDFSWVTKSEVLALDNNAHRATLLEFLHEDVERLSGKEVADAERYYDRLDSNS